MIMFGFEMHKMEIMSYQVRADLETLVAFAAVHPKLRRNTTVINIPL